MSEWKPIETAPKDRVILLWGAIVPHKDDRELYHYAALVEPTLHVGHWDAVDGEWCSSVSTYKGPWIAPLAWQPAPDIPETWPLEEQQS